MSVRRLYYRNIWLVWALGCLSSLGYLGGDVYAQMSYQPEVAPIASEMPTTLVANDPTPTPLPTATPEVTPLPPTPVSVPATPNVTPQPVVRTVAATTTTSTYVNRYYYGYCTWYVANRRQVPPFWGNAVNWYYSAQTAGWRVGTEPAVGAIAWTIGGNHVSLVEQASGTQVYISEMNYNGNWGRVTYRWAPASSFRYIY